MRKVGLVEIELSGSEELRVEGGLFSAYRLVWVLTSVRLSVEGTAEL